MALCGIFLRMTMNYFHFQRDTWVKKPIRHTVDDTPLIDHRDTHACIRNLGIVCLFFPENVRWVTYPLYSSVVWALSRTNSYGANGNEFCTKASWWRAFSSLVTLAVIEVYAFVGFFKNDTAAPLLSPLTTPPASSAPVHRTRTRHQRKEVQ